METVLEVLKLVLFAFIPMYGMYLVVKAFITRELNQKLLETKGQTAEIVVPLRLQAYERMMLFLERNRPEELLRRFGNVELSLVEMQTLMQMEIRNEFAHNLAQQVYMSEDSWQHIKAAMEDTLMVINSSADALIAEANSKDLRNVIFDQIMNRNVDPTDLALKFLKKEVQQLF